PPEISGVLEAARDIVWCCRRRCFPGEHPLQDKLSVLIRPQGKLGDGIAVMDTEWHRTVQAQGGTIVALGGKKHGPVLLLDPVRGSSVVKAWRAEHAK